MEDFMNNEARFQIMFQKHSAIMLLVDQNSGDIIDANLAAENFYGYKINELRAMNIEQINTMATSEMRQERARAYRGEVNYFIFNHKLKNGEIRHVEVYSSPIAYKGKMILFSIVHDISQRRREEEQIKSRDSFQKLIVTLSSDLISASPDNIDAKINTLLEAVGQFFNIDRCYLFQASPDDQSLVLTHEWSKDPALSIKKLLPELSFGRFPWWFEKTRIEGKAYIPDINQIPDDYKTERDILQALKIKSLLNVKIIDRNKLAGFFGYASIGEIKQWRLDEAELLDVLAHIVFDAIVKNKMEIELLAAKEKAEHESNLKTDYFVNMSHELRTPLNVILSAIQLLEHYKNKEEEIPWVKINKQMSSIKRNSLQILRLVNNIIDIAKIDSGFYVPEFHNYNIIAIVSEVVQSVREYARQKNIEIVFKSDLATKMINCDRDIIEQIMINLISNAIKFSYENSIIRISLTSKSDSVIISVTDHGVGIEKEKQSLIFDRYKQVALNPLQKSEGSGIGLALVNSLIEIHGGSICVESQYGKGSEFIVEIPDR